jgi:hypothetical protein
VPDEFDAVHAAFAAWQDVPDCYVRYGYLGTTTRDATNHSDGYNDVSWTETGWSHGSGVIGITTVRTLSGIIVEADMELNGEEFQYTTSGVVPNRVDVHNVVAHEAGHGWVGLNDLYGVPDQEKTMYGLLDVANGEDKKRTLEPEDIAGAQWLYPCSDPATPTNAQANPTAVCEGDSSTLTASVAGAVIDWYTDGCGDVLAGTGNSIVVSPTVTKTYYARARNSATGCESTACDMVTVVVHPLPTATASNDGPVCDGQDVQLTGGPDGMIDYSWSGPAGFTSSQQSPVVSPAVAGEYCLTVADGNGCVSAPACTTVVVYANPTPVITADPSETVCEGTTVTLDAGAGYSTYYWSPGGQTTRTIQVSTSGTYDVTVTDANGCEGSDDITVTVNTNPTPVITPDPSETVCEGTIVTLDAGAGYSTYYWSPGGQTTRTIQVTASGTYDVTVTDANGCQGWDDIIVTVNANPTATAWNDGPVCDGGDVQLIGGPDGMASYSWTGPADFTSSQQNPVVSPAVAGEYCLTVTDANGCVSVPACTTVEVTPLVTLIASEPPADGSLPKALNNVILCSFDRPITLPGSGNPLVIIDITNGCVDVSASFTYSVDADDPNGTTLEARENVDPNDPDSGVLIDLTWYQVESAPSWACVTPFQFEVYTLVGDCTPSARVTTADYSCAKAALGQRGDVRADLNGSGRVTTADYSVVKANLGHRGPTKPALCP